MEKRIRDNRIIGIFLACSLVFYVWLAAQIPYCHDDWDWGLPVGIQQLLTANLNSRYAGNLIEVILTRSVLLKNVTMGLVFTLLPFSTAVLISRAFFENDRKTRLLIPMLMGNILMLTVPLTIWQQTFGWVAGFSNFVVSALFLVFWQLLLNRFRNIEKTTLLRTVLLFLFGAVMQLFLENLTVYVMLLTTVACISPILRKQLKHPCFSLWLGNLLGTVIMFSSSVYGTLAETGTAVNGYRTLSFEKGENPIVVAFRFFRRFTILYPNLLWIKNTVLCCTILLLLILLLLNSRRKRSYFLWCAVDGLLFCYIICYRVWGEIRLPSQWWTNVLSAALAILFFLAVLAQTLLLFRDRKPLRNALLLCWISAPAVIVPMLVITSVGPRSFLTSDLFLAEFALLLALSWVEQTELPVKKGFTTLLAFSLGILWVHFGLVYSEIGAINRSRLQEICSAREGKTDNLLLERFPNGQYLWQTDPEYEEKERIRFYREFYQIPDDVDLWFASWGDRQEREEDEAHAVKDTNNQLPVSADQPSADG